MKSIASERSRYRATQVAIARAYNKKAGRTGWWVKVPSLPYHNRKRRAQYEARLRQNRSVRARNPDNYGLGA